MVTNAALEKNYTKFPEPIKGKDAYKFSYNGRTLYITSWDKTNLSGTFKWHVNQKHDTLLERKTPQQAATVQANNFVYDYSRPYQINQTFLLKHQHCIEYFREMLQQELELSKTHVFLYHSYHTASLIYDLGACLRRISLSQSATDCSLDDEAIMLRTDRSAFNLRTPSAIKSHFSKWYNNTDVWGSNPKYQKFAWVGTSVVLNLFRTNPESTVVRDFQKGYNPGDSPDLNPVLDEILSRFGIEGLREKLLQFTIEADTDVSSFFVGKNPHFFERLDPGADWVTVAADWATSMDNEFADFMENDNQRGPIKRIIHGWIVTLERAYSGAQARGSASKNGTSKELITVTTNPGRYAQIGIPIELINNLAYAAKPFGLPDSNTDHALDKIAFRTDLSIGGQARLFPRPDLMCNPAIVNKTYLFSRGAKAKRKSYLKKIQDLIKDHLTITEGLMKVGYQFDPPDIIVRTHNVQHDNKSVHSLLNSIKSQIANSAFGFACLQECTTNMIDKMKVYITSAGTEYEILYSKVHDSSIIYGCIIYNKWRFTKLGKEHISCFNLKNCDADKGRPIFGAVFKDTYLGRSLLVMSVHAPHNSQTPYRLMSNIQREVNSTLVKAGVNVFSDVAHFVVAGDYNRQDWSKYRELQFGPFKVPLRSAQRHSDLKVTLPKGSNDKKAVDNVLYGSSEWKYVLEQKGTLGVDPNSLGSDHRAVTVRFCC